MVDLTTLRDRTLYWVEFYKRRFGLERWRIDVYLELPDEPHQTYAEVTPSFERQKAIIVVNPFRIEDEESLKETVRHELLHLVISPINLLAKNNSPEVLNFVEECIIRNLEVMYDCMEATNQ